MAPACVIHAAAQARRALAARGGRGRRGAAGGGGGRRRAAGGGGGRRGAAGGRRARRGASVAPRPRRVPVQPSLPRQSPAARSPHAAPAPALAPAWPASRPPATGQMCSLAALARGCRPAAAAKPCCLCWCCCCSCSCLAARGSDGGAGKKTREPGPQEPLLTDGDAPPTLEEIQSWGQSFDRLMRSAAGRKVFRDFLRGEYSEENILFWLACEELKREADPEAVEEKARFIYEDYISILSPKEVSLDSRVREAVNRNMVEPTPHTFDDAQLQIYTLMHRDSYPRFVNSPLYKALARLSVAEGEPPPTCK